MNREINLLSSLPKSKRDIKTRSWAKNDYIIKKAKEFGKTYFDGPREMGYGGYKYDGRYKAVARDIINFFGLRTGDRILDVGCAKGFLVYDFMQEGKMLDVNGVDISKYALENCLPQIAHRVYWGNAEQLPWPDEYFDLVVSINTLHNLPRDKCIKALKEIQRVSKGNSYIVVDSYHTSEEKELFEQWVLTAEFHDYPEGWLKVFEEAGYTGHYSWNIL